MFPVKFSTDTDPKGRNKKALAYVVLRDAKAKCNTHDEIQVSWSFPAQLYTIFHCKNLT